MATTAKKIMITLPPLEVASQDWDRIKEVTGKDDPTPNIFSWIKFWLSSFANRGMMFAPAEIRQLENVLGVEFNRPKDVIDLVLKHVGREDGKHSFPVQIDPAYFGPATDVANARGVTVEQLYQDAINVCLTNGWCEEFFPPNPTYFTDEDKRVIEEFVGKENPFGADISAAVSALKKG